MISWVEARGLCSLGTRPLENRKEGLGYRLGWKCTVHPECWHASDWSMIACLRTFIGNTNHNPLYSSRRPKISRICWREKLLEHRSALIGPTDGQKFHKQSWLRTNNYKFNTFRSVQTSIPAYLPDPPSDFLRAWFRDQGLWGLQSPQLEKEGLALLPTQLPIQKKQSNLQQQFVVMQLAVLTTLTKDLFASDSLNSTIFHHHCMGQHKWQTRSLFHTPVQPGNEASPVGLVPPVLAEQLSRTSND